MSRRYNHSNIYHDDPAIGYSITCVDRPRCWRMGQWLQMHFTLTTRVGIMRALNIDGNEHRRNKNVTKIEKKYSEKVNVNVCITKRCVKWHTVQILSRTGL